MLQSGLFAFGALVSAPWRRHSFKSLHCASTRDFSSPRTTHLHTATLVPLDAKQRSRIYPVLPMMGQSEYAPWCQANTAPLLSHFEYTPSSRRLSWPLRANTTSSMNRKYARVNRDESQSQPWVMHNNSTKTGRG